MKIEANGTTYSLDLGPTCWVLKSPAVLKNNKTGKVREGEKETYHPTIGQALAKIADLEMGSATTVNGLIDLISALRKDLLAANP